MATCSLAAGLDAKVIVYHITSFEVQHFEEDEGFDLLAMVHQQHGMLERLLNGSYVHKVSRVTQVPCLCSSHAKNYIGYNKGRGSEIIILNCRQPKK